MTQLGALLAAGRTSDVYLLGEEEVVKVPRPDVPLNWVEVEANLTSIVQRHGLPAPEVRGFVDVDGRRCVVFERIVGPTMWELILDEPSRIQRLVDELVAIQRGIHASGLPIGLPDHATRTEAKAVACPLIDDAERDEAMTVIRGMPSGAAVLHGDLHPGNVIMSADGPVAVDWFDVSVGHPLADVARSLLLLQPAFDVAELVHLPGATVAVLDSLHQHFLQAWADLVSEAQPELEQWQAVLALARISEGAHDDPGPLLAIWSER